MKLEIGLAGLICLVGLVLYLAAKDPKPTEVGRVMFAVGLLVSLLGAHELFALFK